jgi:hypothetical protein
MTLGRGARSQGLGLTVGAHPETRAIILISLGRNELELVPPQPLFAWTLSRLGGATIVVMEAKAPIKLLQTPFKSATSPQERPTGCYCEKVKRQCGVCARSKKSKN